MEKFDSVLLIGKARAGGYGRSISYTHAGFSRYGPAEVVPAEYYYAVKKGKILISQVSGSVKVIPKREGYYEPIDPKNRAWIDLWKAVRWYEMGRVKVIEDKNLVPPERDAEDIPSCELTRLEKILNR